MRWSTYWRRAISPSVTRAHSSASLRVEKVRFTSGKPVIRTRATQAVTPCSLMRTPARPCAISRSACCCAALAWLSVRLCSGCAAHVTRHSVFVRYSNDAIPISTLVALATDGGIGTNLALMRQHPVRSGALRDVSGTFGKKKASQINDLRG